MMGATQIHLKTLLDHRGSETGISRIKVLDPLPRGGGVISRPGSISPNFPPPWLHKLAAGRRPENFRYLNLFCKGKCIQNESKLSDILQGFGKIWHPKDCDLTISSHQSSESLSRHLASRSNYLTIVNLL